MRQLGTCFIAEGAKLTVKIVELALVIGTLVVWSAIFASHNPPAMTACIASCE
jgi:hypothetical protein